jgi:hypothetical protein
MNESLREYYKLYIKKWIIDRYKKDSILYNKVKAIGIGAWLELKREKFHDEIDTYNSIYEELKSEFVTLLDSDAILE